MLVHTLPPKGGRGGGRGAGPPAQSCSCKPNADGRCCLGTCGCGRAGLGCSHRCGCRGFKLVCGNQAAALAAPKPSAEPPAKKPRKDAAPAPSAGVGHRLADGPFELAAAPDRSRFLAALEARPTAHTPGATTAVASGAGVRAPVPAPADDDEEVIIIDDEDDEVLAKAPPPARSVRVDSTAAAPKPRPPPPLSKPAPRLLPKPVEEYNPFNPPQYMPSGGFKPPKGGELCVRETVNLTDASGGIITAAAVLDTGNEGMTLIFRGTALRAGLCDAGGMPLCSSRVQWTPPIRGVVAGATERLPMLDLEYEMKGKTVRTRGAVTGSHLGCDLLICRRDILMFQNDGACCPRPPGLSPPAY